MTKKKFKIAAVIISYNNKESIKKIISALKSQSYSLGEIIVVDNASKDGSVKMLNKEFPEVVLLANSSNLGVGEGYGRGMDYAHKKGYDWTWLLDGDCLPQKSTLEELIKAYNQLRNTYQKIGILASSPVNPSTGKIIRGKEKFHGGRFSGLPETFFLSQQPFLVDAVISSGSLIHSEVIKEVDLPRSDFFVDFIDYEYCLRVRMKNYQIVYVPRSVIHHRLGNEGIIRSVLCLGRKCLVSTHPSWRMYYIIRNEVYTRLHILRDYRSIFFIGWIVLHEFLSAVVHQRQSIKYIVLGLKDGIRGRLGKVVKPPGDK